MKQSKNVKCALLTFALFALPLASTLPSQQGSLVGWGIDEYGEVSDIPAGSDFVAVAAHQRMALALKSDGSIVAWGRDLYNAVTEVPAGNDFVQITCGYYQCLALRSDGSMVAWGYDSYGQGTPLPGNDWIKVSAGQRFNLALRSDGTIHAWGQDDQGQISQAPTEAGFIDVEAGEHHGVALKADGSLVSWGFDISGLVSNTPGGAGFTNISASYMNSIAVHADGSITAWGGDNYQVVSLSPAGNDFVQVAAGTSFGLGLRTDGSFIAWGNDQHGEIAQAPGGSDYLQVAAGWGWGVALTTRLGSPLLSTTPLRENMPATLSLESCAPDTVVVIAASLVGAGPIETSLGIVRLSRPLHFLPPIIADANGVAAIETLVPLGLAGRTIWLQAIDVSRGELSNGIAEVVSVLSTPSITEVLPDSGAQGSLVALLLHGTGFESGAEIELVGATATIPLTGEWYLHPSFMGGSVDLASAPLGLYTVRVINPSGLVGELTDGFEVLP